MNTAQAINYADPAVRGDGAKSLQAEIVRFVRGIRRPRGAPVTAEQIRRWCSASPADFVDAQIDAACVSGRIRIVAKSLKSHRAARGAYAYEIT